MSVSLFRYCIEQIWTNKFSAVIWNTIRMIPTFGRWLIYLMKQLPFLFRTHILVHTRCQHFKIYC